MQVSSKANASISIAADPPIRRRSKSAKATNMSAARQSEKSLNSRSPVAYGQLRVKQILRGATELIEVLGWALTKLAIKWEPCHAQHDPQIFLFYQSTSLLSGAPRSSSADPSSPMSSTAPRKVFFSRKVPYAIEQFCQRLAKAGANSVAVETFASEENCISRDELLRNVKGCTGLFCLLTDKVDAEVLDAAGPSLRVVSTMSVGHNHIDIEACRVRNVRVGYTPGVLDVSTAETAVALTFAAKRRLLECAASAKAGEWGVWQPFQYCGSDVTGSTIGVVGLGRIGTTYARMLKNGFNCTILYTGPREKPENVEALRGSVEYVDMETLLRESDIVSLHQPLTEATRGSIAAKELQLMKPSAVLINTGRGELVDQDALVNALRNKTIAAAGLDVTTPEPLPPTHPLFGLENCVVMPHIGSATVKTRQAMADIAVANLAAGILGEQLPHGVC